MVTLLKEIHLSLPLTANHTDTGTKSQYVRQNLEYQIK